MGVLPGIDAAHPVILITGANTGIGRITALHLAKLGACMVLAGRDPQRTAPVVQEIQTLTGRADAARFLPLDLADLHSVRQAAQPDPARL
ncbi:MAG: SDR family NAD(P)-dependent oxidoreductase [Betaproteobacteria bacterium]|nr:SDR family NAD(P)-dependent oxidoreductase [Betaproteobacteria bacterium]